MCKGEGEGRGGEEERGRERERKREREKERERERETDKKRESGIVCVCVYHYIFGVYLVVPLDDTKRAAQSSNCVSEGLPCPLTTRPRHHLCLNCR